MRWRWIQSSFMEIWHRVWQKQSTLLLISILHMNIRRKVILPFELHVAFFYWFFFIILFLFRDKIYICTSSINESVTIWNLLIPKFKMGNNNLKTVLLFVSNMYSNMNPQWWYFLPYLVLSRFQVDISH